MSLKLALVLTQNAKMSHFQFWMLSTIEWRLTKLTKDMAELKKGITTVKKSSAAADGEDKT